MNKFLFVSCFLFSITAYAQDSSLRDLKRGRFISDTSFVYTLPYKKGTSCLLVQAYQSNMSHKGEYALDFKMKEGTPVCAARNGVVVAMRKDSHKGGLKPEMLSEGNYIIVEHEDSTKAHYWHLKKDGVLVNFGDTIKTGQVIGYSGNTGYSAFPHLHFEVSAPGKGQVPTRFYTRKGIKYIKPARWHTAI